jgi:hypothetical protein
MPFLAIGVIAGVAAAAFTTVTATTLAIAGLAATTIGVLTKSKELTQFGAGFGLAGAGAALIGAGGGAAAAAEGATALEAGASAATGIGSGVEAVGGYAGGEALAAGAAQAAPALEFGAAQAAAPLADAGIPATAAPLAEGAVPATAAPSAGTGIISGAAAPPSGAIPATASSMTPGTTVAPEVANASMNEVTQAGGFDKFKAAGQAADAASQGGSAMSGVADWAKNNQLIAYGLIQAGATGIAGALGGNENPQLAAERERVNWEREKMNATEPPPVPAGWGYSSPIAGGIPVVAVPQASPKQKPIIGQYSQPRRTA